MIMNYKNLLVFSAIALTVFGISIGYLVFAITEEHGPIGYMKTSFKNGTDTLVCDKVPFRPPFNCELKK